MGWRSIARASPVEEAIGSEAVDCYESALTRLRPEEREAIIARVEMGYSYEELAEAFGKPSPDAARKTAERALVRLAEEMNAAVSERLVPDLAGAVLDGTPIDWAGAESSADEASRPVLAELRILAALADVHRRLPPHDQTAPPTHPTIAAAR